MLEKKENGTKLWKEGEVKGGEGGSRKEGSVEGVKGRGIVGEGVELGGGEGGKGN